MAQFWTTDCQCQITLGMVEALGGANTSMLIAPFTSIFLISMAYAGAGDSCMMEIWNFATCTHSFPNLSGFPQNLPVFVSKIPNKSKYDDYGQLYFQKDVILKPEYLDFYKEIPEIGIHSVDFEDPKTLQLINAGISNFTDQKIEQIVDKFESDLKLFIVGATAIVDKWEVPFNEPVDKAFFINEHKNKTIPMIQQISDKIGYSESSYFHGLRLAFNSSLSRKCTLDMNKTKKTKDCDKSLLDTIKFLIFLPKKQFDLANSLPHLNGDVIEKLLKSDAKEIDLTIPSFNFTFSTGLRDAFTKLGLKRGFDSKLADFSRMADQKVYIGDIVQTTKIEITSKGMDVETAGASKILRQKRSTQKQQVKFEANQPFFYMITSNNHMIQFAGVFT